MMADYCPLRLVDSKFYLDESSCYLQCNQEKTRFQIATGSKVTSFCASTLKCLGLSEGESIQIQIDNKLFYVKVYQNNLEGNILGMDVLSKCKLIIENKRIILTV